MGYCKRVELLLLCFHGIVREKHRLCGDCGIDRDQDSEGQVKSILGQLQNGKVEVTKPVQKCFVLDLGTLASQAI